MNLRRVLMLGLGIALLAGLARQAGPRGRAQRALQEYERLEAQVLTQFDAGEFEKAAATCNDILKLVPDDFGAYYNLACAHARLKQPAVALEDLAKAVDNGFDDPDHMNADPDLSSIRKEKKYTELLAAAKLNERADGGKYEKGEPIAGVKTVEGFPEEGLRYRIRIPRDATEKNPAKLIIWLHPSGESMNAQLEKMAPVFAAHGYALMVFSHKQFMGWTTEESDALVTGTLPALKAYKEIDSARPVLLGYSAGGQLALKLWEDNPAAWSGVIVDAAYPLEPKGEQWVDMGLPKGDAIKKTALHVLIGQNDRGLKRWDIVENKWLGAGVPLTVSRVAGKRFDWMLSGEPVLEETLKWLDELKAGKLPADAIKARELEI